jgi:hypothetical protein
MTACRVCGAPTRRNRIVCASCGAELERYEEIDVGRGPEPIRVRRYGGAPAGPELGTEAPPPTRRRRRRRAAVLLLAAAVMLALSLAWLRR